ncbi:unnamed protein product [Ixodes persulcatus]
MHVIILMHLEVYSTTLRQRLVCVKLFLAFVYNRSMSDKVCTSTRNPGNIRKAECDSMFRKITAASIRPVEVLLERLLLATPEGEGVPPG